MVKKEEGGDVMVRDSRCSLPFTRSVDTSDICLVCVCVCVCVCETVVHFHSQHPNSIKNHQGNNT